MFGATPTIQGQSGYINMPSANVEADGTFSLGYGYDKPYGTLWATSTILPFLQVTGRYVSVSGIPGFSNVAGEYGSDYGRYKDKVIDFKARLTNESPWMPSLSVGMTDVEGTGLFRGYYAVATKYFGQARNLEASIGYGSGRPDGIFAGARWTPLSLPNWSLVAEYDANDYQKDFRAAETFAGQRRGGSSLGLEYRWGWLGVQAARSRDDTSISAFVSIPFSEREFVPKFAEPAYYEQKEMRARPTIAEWQGDPRHGAEMADMLAAQDYKNVRMQVKGHVLHLTLTNTRISNMGRAIGRAARIALAFAPRDIRGLHVTYTRLEQPLATYEFFDLNKLADYLDGRIARKEFVDAVLVRYANEADMIEANEEGMITGVRDGTGLEVRVGRDGDAVQIASEDREANRFKIVPKAGVFFNDPSGAFRYELVASSDYDKRIGNGLYLNGTVGLKIYENVSGVTQPSNSLLPHVRTDVADYKRASRFKLYRLMLNKYMMPAEGLYARASAGIYEEMFRGAGGQILYLPKDSRWAVDLAVDALQQRGFEGWLGSRDYRTVTAIGSLHYRLPYAVTVTGRAGRFLAKDVGVRMEFKRRFASGIEVGAWYTVTNGNDITSPGTPSSPYRDKGIFLSIPLSSMLTADTQANAGFAISPWTRDVGQMVASPGDLYDMVENPRRDLNTFDGLGNFAERADEQNHPAVNPPERTPGNPWPEVWRRLDNSAAAAPSTSHLINGMGVAAAVVGVASLSDKKVDQLAKNNLGAGFATTLDRMGKATPIALLFGAGAAVAIGDDRMRNTGLISIQSALTAGAFSFGSKLAVGRARPQEERGHWARAGRRTDSSFPSNHASIAFAAVTPFAMEYDAPWLYGIAAAGSMGRVAARKHWFSDVVAGGLLGYATGGWLWDAQRDPTKGTIALEPLERGLAVSWQRAY